MEVLITRWLKVEEIYFILNNIESLMDLGFKI